MAIYVDKLEDWGWRLRGHSTLSCHMFTDSADIEELHAFARQIGMKAIWFQNHKVAPHYDLTPARREHAVKLGAIEVGRRESSAIWRRRRELVLATGKATTEPTTADRSQ